MMTQPPSGRSPQAPDRRLTIHPGAVAMTIAGSDPSGGAGLQADLKAFEQNGVYGQAVVTLITVQNTLGVKRIETLQPDLIAQQILAAADDIPPRAIKTGALGNAAMVHRVAETLESVATTVVVDPVLISKHGDRLAGDDVAAAYQDSLMPICQVFTPNRYETQQIIGRELTTIDDMVAAADELLQRGPSTVLIKAGSIDGVRQHFFACNNGIQRIEIDDVDSSNTHGAGCSLSAVIAARLAIAPEPHDDQTILAACRFAIAAVHHGITLSQGLGQGHSPLESQALKFGD